MRFNDQNAVDDKVLYTKYYKISTTPVRGTVIIPKQEAISAVEKNYGYFALLSNDIKDPIEALKTYRLKNISEKAFHNLKERLSMRRTSVSSEEHLEGKLFVQFLALIYLSYIDKAMSDQKLYTTMTMDELLDELDVIECFEHPGHKLHDGEITKKQKLLYSALGVKVPALV